MALQFDKLCLSPKQPVLPVKTPLSPRFSKRFFWSDELMLLELSRAILHRLSNLEPGSQERFWKGEIPSEIAKLLPAGVEIQTEKLIEYCRASESQECAINFLGLKARDERLSAKGRMRVAGLRIDEKSYALHLARCWKTVGCRELPQIIARAAEQDDGRFFIRLGRALARKGVIPEVDWSKPDATAVFLADFCSAAFGKKPGNPSAASIRQWRRRLGLKTVRQPKIRSFTVKNGKMVFA